MSPSSGNSGSLQVINKRQSTASDEIGSTKKFDTSVDIKLDNDEDSTSILRNVIGRKLSDSFSANLHLRCWMDLSSNTVGTKALHFVDLGILAVNASYEVNIFGTPATRIRRPTYGPHWSAPDHIFGEATAVVMGATKSELEYNYKTDFQNWR